MKRVAILGCGPSGLIAAYAAESAGHEVSIFSRRARSATFGAMYLHEPIPGITPDDPELEINIVKYGSRQGYAEKLYGNPQAEVSWDRFKDGPSPGWDLSRAYGKLWERYADRIMDIKLSARRVDLIASQFDLTFSTISAKTLCDDWDHNFTYVNISVLYGPTDFPSRDNLMFYNGLPASGLADWYRYSVIRNTQSWEYALKTLPPDVEVERVKKDLCRVDGYKPLATNCDCRPEIIRLGRFGKWNRHAFTHHSYTEVQNALL